MFRNSVINYFHFYSDLSVLRICKTELGNRVQPQSKDGVFENLKIIAYYDKTTEFVKITKSLSCQCLDRGM
jgi:hypothetical protein